MSPFDLPGPQFLLFYLVFGAIVLASLAVLRGLAEPDQGTKVNLTDPYLIAFLRGGKNEVLRIATVSLIDRGLLNVSGSQLSAVSKDAEKGVRVPVERALLTYFATAKDAASVFSDHGFQGATAGYEAELLQLGLLPGESVKA